MQCGAIWAVQAVECLCYAAYYVSCMVIMCDRSMYSVVVYDQWELARGREKRTFPLFYCNCHLISSHEANAGQAIYACVYAYLAYMSYIFLYMCVC